MRMRGLLLLTTVWVASALFGHVRERRGAIACDCAEDCWCQRPGLRLFRWVLPLGHRSR